ncbi:Do family serine endopeptidase [Geobacter sp. SVR]|uniref:Do family serine endopeptidase n=1 Tax=Geobacter sp. SVR TaxID=2495594 RepID=UPI00143F02D9|nr:Do family serine endopeptidase [Geobacter sp. SVR]BCS52946.1 peptidase [Geobacter sp. SVR]GCF84330.1 peptidase [Geobacter sp. SVR]
MPALITSIARLVAIAVVCTLAVPSFSAATATLPDFVELSKRLKPTVVNIRTVKNIKPKQRTRRSPNTQQSPYDNFFDEFFGQFFDQNQQRPRREQNLGSGFIISSDGYILTNFHVVNGADEVLVKLADGRELKGQIKGGDEKFDLALIKITDKEKVPALELGDSDKLEVGEWVMAIGNPFGLSQTVTAGIVSAKGRVIGSGPYDDFIQTDASINPGNSGGPLFNAEGKVVGIATAIVANGKGIGFATPINMAKAIVDQLRETGKVTRGYLGVQIQKLTPELAKSFNLDADKGALVADVIKGSPAEKAGIKTGDIILQYEGKPIVEYTELPRMVAATPLDKKVKITIFREGQKSEVVATIDKLKEEAEGEAAAKGEEGQANDKLGFTVSELTKDLAARFGYAEGKGLVITEVKPGSPADDTGIPPGTLLLEINGQRPTTLEQYNKLVAQLKSGDVTRLLVKLPDGSVHYVAMTLP